MRSQNQRASFLLLTSNTEAYLLNKFALQNRPCDLYLFREGSGSFRALRRALKRPVMSSAVRNAVYTTVAIVSTYLMCSGLHMILTALERTDSSLLKSSSDPNTASTFYTMFGDTVSKKAKEEKAAAAFEDCI